VLSDLALRSPSAPGRPARAVEIGAALAAILVACTIAAVATRFDILLLAVAGCGGLLVFVLSLRWPVASLFVVAATIPFDEAVRFGDLGTVGRSAAILFAVSYALPRLGRLTLRAMPGPAWGYVAWAILSAGWALDQATAIQELGTLVQLFLLGLLVADLVIHRPTVVRPLLWVYTLSATVSALVGIAGYLGGQLNDGVRVAALPDQDPAQYAAVLLPALVFSLYELIDGRWLLVSMSTAAITMIGILLSGTRGAWLAVAVVGVLFILPHLRRRRRVAAAGALAGIVVVAALIPGVVDFVGERAGTAISTGGSGRTDIWTVGLAIVASEPVTGVGYANFPVAFTPQIVRETALADDTGVNRAPHNVILSNLAELGPIGLALMLLFIVPLLVRPGWGPDATVIQACLVALATSAMFLDILDNRKQVWLLLGIAAGLQYLARARDGTIDRPTSWPLFARLRRLAHRERSGPPAPAEPVPRPEAAPGPA